MSEGPKREEGGEDVKGTLICGADGAVYFIPNDDMEAFRIPDEHAGPVRNELRQPEPLTSPGGSPRASGIIIVGGVTGRRLWAAGPTLVPGVVFRSR